MCEYCKGKNILTIDGYLAIYINNQNKLKAITTNREFGEDINYCPKCRKEAGRVKHITLKEMLEEIIQCILEQKEIKDYYWKGGEEEFRRITEIDLLDRIRTSNDDFTEFEWELAESRLYKVE